MTVAAVLLREFVWTLVAIRGHWECLVVTVTLGVAVVAVR